MHDTDTQRHSYTFHMESICANKTFEAESEANYLRSEERHKPCMLNFSLITNATLHKAEKSVLSRISV